MLRLQLFGPPRIWDAERPVALNRRKSRALLFYLATRSEPVARDALLSFFWPDLDRAAAQQSLRTTVHGLRKTLGPLLDADDDYLALAESVDVDVRRFRQVLARAHPERAALAAALDLYQGDFLAGFELPDGPDFNFWVDSERTALRQAAMRAYVNLAAAHEAAGDDAAALAVLLRGLALDPLREDLQRDAMRLHYRTGDRVGAIRRYEQLREMLDAEIGVPPMAETSALYDAIITDSLPERPLSVAPPEPARRRLSPEPDALPFTGRDREIAQLQSAVASGHFALLEGEPGIGKTRLACEFARRSGARLLLAPARELQHSLPYQPIIEALRTLEQDADWPRLREQLHLAPIWQAEVGRLLPDLFGNLAPETLPLSAPADEARLWEGLRRFFDHLAEIQPLLLLFDDLHWADEASIALLGYLLRPPATSPAAPRLLLLATSRPLAPASAAAGLLQLMSRENRLSRIGLQRLSAGEIGELARNVDPAAAELADWLQRSSEGNPYILAELLRYAREQHLLDQGRLADLRSTDVLPQSVYSLIQQRLARLSEPARRVLDAGVAVGREFEFAIVARAAALSENAALDALDELRAAGLIYPREGLRYSFDHSLTMEVAYREVGEARHRLLHRRVAEALEQVHRHNRAEIAGLLASHFAEGGAPERAAPYALQAGRQAAALAAWREAIAFFEQAIAGMPAVEQGTVLTELGEARLRAGEAAAAADTFRSAADLAVRRGDTTGAGNQARLARAEALLPLARFAEVIELVQQVLADGRAEQAAQAEFLWGTALSLEGADLAAAAEHLGRAEMLFHQPVDAPDRVGLVRTRFELGSLAAQQGELERAVTLYREALLTAVDLADTAVINWRVLINNNLAYHLHLLADPAAETYLAAGMTLAQDYGILGVQPYLYSTGGEIALAAGDLATAESYFRQGLELAERLNLPERVAGIGANLGRLALARGETSLAIYELSTALARAEALGAHHLAAQIRIWLAPLLPLPIARRLLAAARRVAESGPRRLLLAQIAAAEQQHSHIKSER